MKKIPMRKCVATNESLPKKELIRIVRTPEGTIEIDETGKRNGRGAYLKRSVEALEAAMKRKSLVRSLECEIPEEIYDKLRCLANEGCDGHTGTGGTCKKNGYRRNRLHAASCPSCPFADSGRGYR